MVRLCWQFKGWKKAVARLVFDLEKLLAMKKNRAKRRAKRRARRQEQRRAEAKVGENSRKQRRLAKRMEE